MNMAEMYVKALMAFLRVIGYRVYVRQFFNVYIIENIDTSEPFATLVNGIYLFAHHDAIWKLYREHPHAFKGLQVFDNRK